MIRHLALCAESLLTTTDWQLPTELPPVAFEWPSPVTTLQQGRDSVRIYRLTYPVTDVAGYQMTALRQTFFHLSPEDYALAGKAAELLYWDGNTRYCGCCGGTMRWKTEISKQCEYCGKELWPSPATAIIVRINRGDQILMVQARNFRRADMYGLVSGFLETGETLEQCVEREVKEETGLSVSNIRYFGSQPWPFPCGLMVGFTAEYAGGDIHVQAAELKRANWFSRDALPEIPDEASIAHWLIADWMNQPKG